MPSPFDGFTFQLATASVSKPAWFDEAKKMAFDDEPDPYLGGDGFLGPTGDGDLSGLGERAARMALAQKNVTAVELKRKFVPEDVLAEIDGRRADAVTAQPPRYGFQVARPLGEWVEGEDGAMEFKASELRPKPADIIHVGGEEVYDPEQRDSNNNPIVTGVTRPSAATFEAADSKHYAEESKDLWAAILRHARQLYVEISGDATASGVSRQQARQDFLQDATRVKGIVDRAGAAVLELVWDLACHLSGKPARDYDLECTFDCRITMPEPTPGEQTASLQLMEKGVWSRARTMGFNNVDDVEAEVEEIAQEEQAEAERQREMAPQRRRLPQLEEQIGGDGAAEEATL